MTQTIEEVWAEVGQRTGAAVSCRQLVDITVSGGMFHRLTLETSGPQVITGEGKYQPWSGGSLHLQMEQPAPARFFLRVYPWSYADLFTRGLGAQDIIIGDPTFDKAYIVKSNHVEWTRLWLSSELQALILRAGDVSLSIEDDVASLSCKLSLSDPLPEKLTRALAALSVFGLRGVDFLREWERLAQQLSGVLSSQRPCLSVGDTVHFEQRGLSLCLALSQEKSGFFSAPKLYTTLSVVSAHSATGAFWVGDDPPLFAKRLARGQSLLAGGRQLRAAQPEGLVERLRLVEGRIEGLQPRSFFQAEDGPVSLVLRGLVSSHETISRAAEILTLFCPASPQGPYR